MRHQRKTVKLGRKQGHRDALPVMVIGMRTHGHYDQTHANPHEVADEEIGVVAELRFSHGKAGAEDHRNANGEQRENGREQP